MTDLTPQIPAGRQLIEGYGEGQFHVGGVLHKGSIIVLALRTLPWPVATVAEVTLESLDPVTSAEPKVEILLIGCGRQPAPIKSPLKYSLKNLGVSVELMDTGAACRTYNVLLSEERHVAAALIALR
ncbi:MAG TPA: Mth938-like domain-containing protein [Alphaproteobacteria bacterium]|nr:Mth938-like domain-containing protein [Alphaproteobacteria bacterium]